LKKRLEEAKHSLGEPISRVPETKEAIHAGMLPGASIIDKPLMRVAGKISSKVKKWLKGEPKDWKAKYYNAIRAQEAAARTHEQAVNPDHWQAMIAEKHRKVLDSLKKGEDLDRAIELTESAIKSHTRDMGALDVENIGMYENVLDVLREMKKGQVTFGIEDTSKISPEKRRQLRKEKNTQNLIATLKDIVSNESVFRELRGYQPTWPEKGGSQFAREWLEEAKKTEGYEFDYQRAKKELNKFIFNKRLRGF